MSKNHIYGLGNALVDIEIEVKDDELKRMSVDKGVMTLIDEQRHHELLGHVEGQKHNRACGGSAANTTIAVAQLGGKSFYSCSIGSDETGDFYFEDLQREGVASILDSAPRAEGVTGKCLVMITPDADRSMNTYLGIASDLTRDSIDLDVLKSSNYLYIEGYLASSQLATNTSVYAIKHAKDNSVPVAISLSDLSMINFCRHGLDAMLEGGIDLLFSNEVEALAYTDSDDLDTACERMKSIAKEFVVTLGPKGAIVFDGKAMIEIAPNTVETVDTNGAGDLFAGSFLYALSNGYSHAQAGAIASYASATLVTVFGPRLKPEHVEKVRKYARSLA